MLIRLVVIFATLPVAACTTSTAWEQAADVTPMSYAIPEQTLNRHIGKLRRIAVIPGTFEYVADGKARANARDAMKHSILDNGINFLTKERGYEAQLLDDMEKASASREATSQPRSPECLRNLLTWAKSSGNGSEPTAKVTACVSKIGRPLGVDGLMVIHASVVHDKKWRLWLTVLTASLAWPTLMSQFKVDASADLFEIATGRIVWRTKFNKSAAEALGMNNVADFLLTPIEHALPRVLIERN